MQRWSTPHAHVESLPDHFWLGGTLRICLEWNNVLGARSARDKRWGPARPLVRLLHGVTERWHTANPQFLIVTHTTLQNAEALREEIAETCIQMQEKALEFMGFSILRHEHGKAGFLTRNRCHVLVDTNLERG